MKRFYFFALVAAMFAACTSNMTDEQAVCIDIATPETLIGTFEGDEMRIQLDNGKTVWTADDLVSVFYLSNANQKWQYQGETGERTGNLKQVEAGKATETMKRVVVVYPYNENYYINTDTYNVKGWLPAEQTYLADSYGLNGNIMISQSEYNQFSLKNVCGWLKLQLTGNGETVQSITLKGNNGEQVAGEVYINSADATASLAADMGSADDNDNSAGGNLVFEDTILTEVTLKCGEGVELGAEATAFYIVLPPQTFENGFTVEIEAMDGHIMTKSTDKTLTIERNHIQPMTAFDFAPSYPLSNEIFYTASEQVTPTNPEAFGTTFISSSWDAETGTGVMLFEDELSYIGDYAFEGNAALLSVLLPNSVTELRNCCFRYCSNLTKAVIPGEITDFHSASFEQCHALATINCRYSTSDLRHVVMNNIYLAYAPAGAEDCIIPDGVKYVESYVFRGSNIASVVIPASVNKIGEQAFLKSANLMAVYCKPTIPPAINASVNGGIFDGNASDRKIYVPRASVDAYKVADGWSEYADNFVAYDFEKGEVVEIIPETWKIYYTATAKVEPYNKDGFGAIIKSNEWDSTTGEGVITFNGEVSTIGANTFYMRSTLQSIHIPKMVTSIKAGAFRECLKLKNVYLNSGVESIGSNAFVGCFDFYNSTYGSFNIHINSIEDWCKIDMPKEITSGQETIYLKVNDISVRDIIIPETITTIKPYAFRYVSVRSVTIHEGISSVGDRAFYECGLKEVYCKSLTPPVGGSDMFEYNSNELKIYVPRASVDAYKAAEYWSKYKSYIEPYDF